MFFDVLDHCNKSDCWNIIQRLRSRGEPCWSWRTYLHDPVHKWASLHCCKRL